MESALLIFMNEDSQCLCIFPMHRSLTREQNKKRLVIFQSYRMSLWEHLVLTALCPDSTITVAALTKYIPGILKIS